MLKEQIRRLAGELTPQMIDDRRHFHRHPELSFEEYSTSNYIRRRLDSLGIACSAAGGTGLIAEIRGSKPSGRVIALRADMDALPIVEAGRPAYRSINEGVMHACGHDAHMASLLGTAAILQRLRAEFGGTVRLLFQPGEEVIPGGATLMIRDGALESPKPAVIIGQHVMPSMDCGTIAVRKGRFMASMDELDVVIHGKGGHAAQPASNIDPVVIAAYMIVALQQLVSRQADPAMPTVLSFGRVIADGAVNVIPDRVTLRGTFRTMDEGWRAEAHSRMKKMATSIAEGMGGSCTFDILRGYPALINADSLAERIAAAARDYLGEDTVSGADQWMAAEDFAYYTQAMEGCFYLLGCGRVAEKDRPSLHSPVFDIDEEALTVGAGFMAYLAMREVET